MVPNIMTSLHNSLDCVLVHRMRKNETAWKRTKQHEKERNSKIFRLSIFPTSKGGIVQCFKFLKMLWWVLMEASRFRDIWRHMWKMLRPLPPCDGDVAGKVTYWTFWLVWHKLKENSSMLKLFHVEIIQNQLECLDSAWINHATKRKKTTRQLHKKSKWLQEIKKTGKTAVQFRWLLMTVSVALGGLNPFSVTWKITATQLIDQTIPAS